MASIAVIAIVGYAHGLFYGRYVYLPLMLVRECATREGAHNDLVAVLQFQCIHAVLGQAVLNGVNFLFAGHYRKTRAFGITRYQYGIQL